MTNTIEIVVRAVDQATRPLRDVSREVDALAARLRQIGVTSAPGLPAFPLEFGGHNIPMPRGGVVAQSAPPAEKTTVIHVTLPEAALRDPGRARAMGEAFGDAIARRLRERG